MRQSIAWIACLLLFSASAVSAQTTFNPKVGVNVYGLDAKFSDYKTEARAGWNAGFDLRSGRGIFFLNPGVHYFSYTARLIQDPESNGNNVSFKDETTIQSLKVPLNIGLRLTGDNGILGIHAKGGITPTYVLNVKERPNFSLNVDDLNRFTWGANVGVGVDILFLTAELNYEMGLNDYFKNVEGKNNTLTLSVGLKF